MRLTRGIFKCDSLLPLLFVLALNPISVEILKLQGCYKLEREIARLLYVDDWKVFAESATDLNRLPQWSEMAKRKEMRV